MRFFHFKKKFFSSNVFQLSLLTAVFWMGMALAETIWSVYVNTLVGSAVEVGLIASGLTIVSLITSFIAPKVLRNTKETQLYIVSMLLMAGAYTVFLVGAFVLMAFAVIGYSVKRLKA